VCFSQYLIHRSEHQSYRMSRDTVLENSLWCCSKNRTFDLYEVVQSGSFGIRCLETRIKRELFVCMLPT